MLNVAGRGSGKAILQSRDIKVAANESSGAASLPQPLR